MVGPLFTVVMPAHNAAGTIAESIASVRAQTCDDWELIVIDDSSTDDSVERATLACAGMPQQLTMLSIGRQAPAGPSVARNRGLDRARGSLVAFLDADDLWDPELLAVRAANFDAHPEAKLVWGPTVYWYPGRADRSDYVEGLMFEAEQRSFAAGEVVRHWFNSLRETPCIGPTVVRREAAQRAGGFPAALRRGEDVALWAAIAADACVLWDRRVLHRYRRHSNSSTTSARVGGTRSGQDLDFARWAMAFARRRGDLGCRAVAARNLHALAQQASADRPPFMAQLLTSRLLLSEPGARRYGWWLLTDWLLPRSYARRAVSLCYQWSGANIPTG